MSLNMEPELLESLPEDHPKRNTPLKDLEVERRYKQSKQWNPFSKSAKISAKTYNQISKLWAKFFEWRA